MALKDNFVRSAKEIFAHNFLQGHSKWLKKDYSFIAPASVEYNFQFLWDTAFHAIVLTHFDNEWAKREIRNYLQVEFQDGFMPHVIFWGNQRILPRWCYIESKFAVRPLTTAITQPPLMILAAERIYEKDKDIEFIKEVLPKLSRRHKWLLENRDPDGDYLISIISPNESGMDELPVFQHVFGYKGHNAIRLHYFYRKADFLNKGYIFNSKRILERDYFNVEELLFNVVFIEGCRAFSRLSEIVGDMEESKYYATIAAKAEKSLLKKCWNEEESIFYSLYSKDEKHAKVKSIASLLPLFLDGLKGEKLKLLVEKHLLNPEEFWTPYPIPSVAKSEKYYVPTDTPFYEGKLLWRGPTWVNTNWFVVKGLQKHGYHDIADEIIKKMSEMIEKYGFREYYNPETGQGYRREHFGWSTLIVDMVK